MSMTPTRQASVAAVVMTDGSGRLGTTVTAIEQQVYELVGTIVVGSATTVSAELPTRSLPVSPNLAEAFARIEPSVEYLWFVAEGASPRPDALAALVRDAHRTQAGVIGSKIIGDDGSLYSVGVVTDAFCVAYTGLDSSEKDQGQYDVVRDVAAVSGKAMLVRRDLLAGLGGIDSSMAPAAAAVDLAQRARLKGAKVVMSAASEVAYDVPQGGGSRWREEAGRIRSMIKVYGPITLLWTIPLDFTIGIIEVIVSIFLGKWYGSDFVKSWGWNVIHIVDTVSARRRARSGRVVGDEELFRFQRRGSVKISGLWSESAEALRSRLPGDDRLSVASIGNEMRQPVFVVGVLAVLFVLISARNIWSNGFPAVGYTLPFPTRGGDVLSAYAGGWNPAGLGSSVPLRPLLAIAGVAKVVMFNSALLPEYVLGVAAMLAGIWGTMRLLRTWSVSAVPGFLAGVIYFAGPAARGIAGNTDIGTLLALGALPWALRLALKPVGDGGWAFASRLAAVVLTFGLLGSLSPLLLLVPVPAIGLYALIKFTDADAWRAFILSLVGTAGGALLLSPWIWSTSIEQIARDGYAYWHISQVTGVATTVVVVAAVVAARRALGLVAGWGALLAGLGLLGSRSGDFGFGVEFESVSLAVLSLGVALAVGVVAESVADPEGDGWRRFAMGIGTVGIVILIVASLTIVLGGRIGLPGDVFVEAYSFTLATEGEAERSRLLVVGPPELLPGDSRTVGGGAYRVISAPVPDLGEARLAARLAFDDLLEQKLETIISGETKRAGAELAVFGIRWIVVMGGRGGSDTDDASAAWRDVFAGQLDLIPLTASVGNAVFVTDIQTVGRALTTTANSWARDGWTYEGNPEQGRRVFVAENPNDGWGPPPRRTIESMNEISSETGVATFAQDQSRRVQAMGVLVGIVLLTGTAIVGRRRS